MVSPHTTTIFPGLNRALDCMTAPRTVTSKLPLPSLSRRYWLERARHDPCTIDCGRKARAMRKCRDSRWKDRVMSGNEEIENKERNRIDERTMMQTLLKPGSRALILTGTSPASTSEFMHMGLIRRQKKNPPWRRKGWKKRYKIFKIWDKRHAIYTHECLQMERTLVSAFYWFSSRRLTL